jgi:hypothetical protein
VSAVLWAWLPPLAALLVVLAGAALLWSGVSRTAAFGGAKAQVGRLPRVTQPVVVTSAGMTQLAGATLRIRASSGSASAPVFIGVGRADDVDAYLGDAARAEVTSLDRSGVLGVRARSGRAEVPEPSGADVWAAESRNLGVAELAWPRTAGPWRVVVATDGRTPPSAVEFTWSGTAGSSPAPALIAIGAVLIAVGLAGLLAMRSGRIFAGAQVGTRGGTPAGTAGGRPRRSGRRADTRRDRRAERRRAAAERATEVTPPVPAADEGATTMIPKVGRRAEQSAPPPSVPAADEGATTMIPKVGRRAEPPTPAPSGRRRADAPTLAQPPRVSGPPNLPAPDEDEDEDDEEAPVVVQPFRRRTLPGQDR